MKRFFFFLNTQFLIFFSEKTTHTDSEFLNKMGHFFFGRKQCHFFFWQKTVPLSEGFRNIYPSFLLGKNKTAGEIRISKWKKKKELN